MRLNLKHLLVLWFATIATALAVRAADNGRTDLIPNYRADDDAANQRVTLQATLIVASDEGTTDASLASHEATLRRVLRFKSFRRVGGSTASPLGPRGETTVEVGAGYSVDFWVNWITDREVEYGVRWFKGRLTLANTTLTRPRRSTSVVGGPATEDGQGTYAVIVTAR
jgi:hypothetical protein